eukprot:scaffold4424_cov154-Skeletonema_menzelii.AAC.11
MAVAMVDYLALMMWLDLEMARSMETMISMVVVRVHYLALLIEMAIVKAGDRMKEHDNVECIR